MAFALEHGEGVTAGIERIAREEARAALGALDPVDGEIGDVAVHEARKRAKRVRAMVRLARSGLSKGRRRALQRTLRDAGRELAEVRDARVRLDTLDALTDGPGAPLGERALTGLRERLAGAHDAARMRALADGVAVGAAAQALAAVADGPAWEVDGGLDVVHRGLLRCAERAWKAHAAAGADPTGEHLHAWRKRAKDLRHVSEVIADAWPPVLTSWAEQLHALTDALGDHHDLAELIGVVATAGDAAFASDADRDAVRDVLIRRAEEAAAAAFALGARVHAEDPEALAERLTAYLSAWACDAAG